MMTNFNATSKELMFDSVRLKHYVPMYMTRCATVVLPMESINHDLTAIVSFIKQEWNPNNMIFSHIL
jgi:hypothetical protein